MRRPRSAPRTVPRARDGRAPRGSRRPRRRGSGPPDSSTARRISSGRTGCRTRMPSATVSPVPASRPSAGPASGAHAELWTARSRGACGIAPAPHELPESEPEPEQHRAVADGRDDAGPAPDRRAPPTARTRSSSCRERRADPSSGSRSARAPHAPPPPPPPGARDADEAGAVGGDLGELAGRGRLRDVDGRLEARPRGVRGDRGPGVPGGVFHEGRGRRRSATSVSSTAAPRSLKDPVGLADSTLKWRRPSRAGTSGVPPSPRVTGVPSAGSASR